MKLKKSLILVGSVILAFLCAALIWCVSHDVTAFDQYGVYRLGELIAGDSVSITDNRHYVFRPEYYFVFVTDREDMYGVPMLSGRAYYSKEPVSLTEFSDLGFSDSNVHTKINLSDESVRKYSCGENTLYLVDGNLWIFFYYGRSPKIYQLEKVPIDALEQIAGISYDGLTSKEDELRSEGKG